MIWKKGRKMKNHQNSFRKNDHIDIVQKGKRRILPKITSIIFMCLKPEAYSEPCQTYKMECFAKINDVKGYFRKIFNLRCLTGFWIWLCSCYIRGCLCGNWKSSFLRCLIFNWRTFLRRVTARWSRRWAKNEVSTNQNSRNRWCQIARRIIWLLAIFLVLIYWIIQRLVFIKRCWENLRSLKFVQIHWKSCKGFWYPFFIFNFEPVTLLIISYKLMVLIGDRLQITLLILTEFKSIKFYPSWNH